MKSNNATMEWLDQKHPALTGAVKAGGMTVREAFVLAVGVEQMRADSKKGVARDSST